MPVRQATGDGVVDPGVADVDQQAGVGAVGRDALVRVALVEAGVVRLAVLAESLEPATGGCVGWNLPQMFGPVETLPFGRGVSSTRMRNLWSPWEQGITRRW